MEWGKVLDFREKLTAEQAAFPIAAAGGAVFAAVENNLEVEAVPRVAGEEFLQVALGDDDVFSGGEFPAGGEAVDVGVDGKCRDAERLRHHDRRGLVTHAGQGF